MAASVEIDPELKQGLLELRSEEERLRMLARLFKDGIKRLERARKIADRARTNGKVVSVDPATAAERTARCCRAPS